MTDARKAELILLGFRVLQKQNFWPCEHEDYAGDWACANRAAVMVGLRFLCEKHLDYAKMMK